MSTISSYMAIITSTITPVLFAALSRYQNDDVKFKKTYFDFQRITATLVIPMGIGIFLFQDLVTEILLGSQWTEASGCVGIWGLTGAFSIVFANLSSEAFRSKGHPKISLIVQAINLMFIVPTLLIAIRYDFRTLYTARSLIRFQYVITAMIALRILYKFRIWETIKNVMPMLLSTAVMGVVGFVLKRISGNMVCWDVSLPYERNC